MKVFTIDLSRCVGCYNCQVACKDEHCGNDWTPYARPQPETGQFWMKVNYEERGTIPKVRVTYQPVPSITMKISTSPRSAPAAPTSSTGGGKSRAVPIPAPRKR
jgi:Fe-S-cluster-containing dehydrogenase component